MFDTTDIEPSTRAPEFDFVVGASTATLGLGGPYTEMQTGYTAIETAARYEKSEDDRDVP